ncbi:MAG: GNAT family protein [Ornithinimicrobium sp.]|uniref:GNAT family N-acetyltransferase n=1 Tax=Ornithinimicrobium sp. TaxID=1977084 RepID=UPI0026DEA683|nr:GNAT family protein [Ornithinimicrobium sp.]MDO5740397.1 GNAT family protein [Ornithinimicrobium sp.]
MSWQWPVSVATDLPTGQHLALRALRRSDRAQWQVVRERNHERLAAWEATVPGESSTRTPFGQLRRGSDRAARAGAALPFVIEVDGTLVGAMQLFDVIWSSRRAGSAGYWLDREATGRGYATWALALLIDHVLLGIGLHRVEVAILPHNAPSLAVAARLRLPEEGLRRGLMHVEGHWRDHRVFAVVAEDVAPGGYAQGGLIRLLRRTA